MPAAKLSSVRFQHTVEIRTLMDVRNISADIRIKQNRVGNAVRIFAVATDGDVNIQPDVAVDYAERNRRRRAVFIPMISFVLK